MRRYRLARAATDDLFNVFVEGVEQFGECQAKLYQQGLERAFGLLGEFPDMGRVRPDNGPMTRTYPFQSHVVVYRRDDLGGVRILRIRHAREDWQDDPIGGASDT